MPADTKAIEVFYVDDSAADRLLFQATLQEIPIAVNVITAENGKEAMEMLNDRVDYMPDIIILDHRMPLKDGNECLEEIRANKRFQDTFVAMFTTSSNPKDIEDAYKRKANLYIQKPFHVDTQIQLFKKLFSLDRNNYFPQPPIEMFVLEV